MLTRDDLSSASRRLAALFAMGIMLLPLVAAAVPVQAVADPATESPTEAPWWETTNMDSDGDGVADMVWKAVASTTHEWVDDEGRIGVIVDFDHTPTAADRAMLEDVVDFQFQWDLYLIDALAGRVPVERIEVLASLPGVVMVELDGVLIIGNADVKTVHGVWDIYEETGYDGAGTSVAIIDTGIDGAHVGLDDLDDDNTTDDPKIIGFYDVVNNADKTNGTEVFPYDDQGHGSHCAGTTAGTGAPDYAHTGVAPQAYLVGVKVLDAGGSGSFANVMAGMQWTVDKRHDFNIRAASMSLGGPGAIEWTSDEEDSVNRMANEMVRAGIAMFIAAGNSAVSAQIGTPGSAEDVITVGALDKDTSIAVYSSQGPTEEGRIKPNVAMVGSNVMSVASNTGNGYTDMSGTSMATPGAAGVAALMYQANPDLSPFDVRNIMQETATYRTCHYMFANEPCAEDLIPKNRQNNVYGHGQVEALPAVMEAANRVYGFTDTIMVNLTTEPMSDNKVHVGQTDEIAFRVEGTAEKVQWRTWDMRDEWMDLDSFAPGDTAFELSHGDFVDRLKYLPGNSISGNQTLMVRALSGTNASANVVVDLHIMGDTKLTTQTDEGGMSGVIIGGLSFLVVLLTGAVIILVLRLIDANQWQVDLSDDEELKSAVDEV